MAPNEVEDVFFADAMDVASIPVVPTSTLKAFLEPAVLDPTGNLVMVFPKAQLKVSHSVTIANAARGAQTLELIND